MKNVLLLVHDDPGQEARLQAALDLARALGGHLTCLDVALMPVLVDGGYLVPLQVDLLEAERARETENRKALEARLAREDVPWTWIDTTDSFAPALNRAARIADLIVVNRRLDSAAPADMRAVATDVIIGSGRAVVAVPENAAGFNAAGRALVAWDGSEEAMKAMQTAVPELKLASSVTVLEIDDGSIETPAEEAAAYLSRHGVSAEVLCRPKGVLPIGDTILAEARSYGADYIVMGGFGHSRVVEALFGGVSREMLTESPVPIVMAH